VCYDEQLFWLVLDAYHLQSGNAKLIEELVVREAIRRMT
jgi:hypothetical protein